NSKASSESGRIGYFALNLLLFKNTVDWNISGVGIEEICFADYILTCANFLYDVSITTESKEGCTVELDAILHASVKIKISVAGLSLVVSAIGSHRVVDDYSAIAVIRFSKRVSPVYTNVEVAKPESCTDGCEVSAAVPFA